MFNFLGSSGLIIQVLCRDFPLSPKEIFSRLQREHGANLTYQAVHKKINELMAQGVLEKENSKYQLNKKWISESKDFFSYLDDFYSKKAVSSLVPKETATISHTFSSPMGLARFVISFASDFPNPENKALAFLWWSYYPTFSLSESYYKKMRAVLKKNNLYIRVHCQTPVDASLEKEYLQLGAKVKSGENIPINPDILVNGDHVCFIYFPQKFRVDWEKYCLGAKGKKVIYFAKLLSHVFDTAASFNVVVTRSPALAEQIRLETISHFK